MVITEALKQMFWDKNKEEMEPRRCGHARWKC